MRILLRVVPLLFLSLVTTRGASLYDIPLKDIDGQPTTLAPFQG